MKKLMNIFVLVAAAAMTLVSCQKNEINGPVKQEVHFTINAGIAETKTIITDNGDGTYTPSWRNEDKIGIFFTEPTEKVSKVEAEFSNTKEDGETASFEGTASVEGEGTFYAFYPSSAFNQHYGDGTIRLDLPASQKPTSTSFDPACDILVAQPCGYIADGETVVIDNLYFARLMSVLRVNLVGEYAKDQIVESFSVEVDVNANVDITGNAKVDYKNATISAWNNGNVNRNVVTATYTNEEYITIAGTNNAAYLVVAPVTIPSGTTLTFTIETENYDIVKTVTAPEDMVMPAGNIAVINLTIAEENCTAKTEDTSDYSGEWLITGVKDEQVYAASAYVSGSNLKSVAISIENGQILEVDGIANCMMTLTKIADGDYAGMYTITDVNGKYLYAASSSGNQLKGATEVSVNAYWTVALQENGTYSIVASESSNRNVMQFNGSDATNVLFNCYSSASQSPVTLYPYSMVKADTTPRITVEDTEYNVSADDETLEFSYNTKNIDGTPTVSVADGATMTNVEADAEAGIVTVIFDANAEEVEKTATLVLSYEGAESVSVTITQAAKAAEGAAYYEKVTSASAPADWSGTYLIVANTNVATVIEGTWLKFASVEINDNKIESTDIIDAYAVTIEKVSSQSYYTIKLANGQYLGTPSSNSIKQNASAGTDFYWKFSLADDLVKIEANAYSGRILRLNGTSGFRTYTSTTGTQATLYKLIGGEGGETPEPELQERNIAFSLTTATATVGEDFTEPTLTGATDGVTYSSSNTSVATVNETTGEVTLVAAGETTITATAAADATYKAGEASYTLTVSAGSQGGETSKTWKLVTDASTLNAGDKLAIVSTSKGTIAGSLSSTYLTSVVVSIANNEFTSLPSGAVEFTLGGASGAWTLAGSDGKLLGATDVKKVAWGSGTTTWSISIDDGDATIQNGTSSYGRFLYNNSATRFTTYTSEANSGMLLPQIYRYE